MTGEEAVNLSGLPRSGEPEPRGEAGGVKVKSSPAEAPPRTMATEAITWDEV